MSYIGIATKEYGQGRICLSTDRISGFRTGHGYSSSSFWRKMFEWVSGKKNSENIKVGVLLFIDNNFEYRLKELSPVSYQIITTSDITKNKADNFDILLFIGTPKNPDSDVKTRIKDFLEKGKGIIIETPCDENTIDILGQITSVQIESQQRPSFEYAYWTKYGSSHFTFTENVKISILQSINSDSLNGWKILLSDTQTYLSGTSPINTDFKANDSMISEIGVFQGSYMKNGLVVIEEGEQENISSSSQSSSSEFYITSTSSSSSSEFHEWNLCNNLVAQWKLNDNRKNPVILDETNNLNNMGVFYSNIFTLQTSDTINKSVVGKINQAIYFGGSGNIVTTTYSNHLKFIDDSGDLPFSVSCWVYSSSGTGIIIAKQNVWEIGIEDYKLYFSRFDDYGKKIKTISMSKCIQQNKWQHVVVNSTPYFSVDSIFVSVGTTDEGYIPENNSVSFTCIGHNLSNRKITITTNGLWKNSSSNVYFDANGNNNEVFTDGAYLNPDFNGIFLPAFSCRQGSLICMFEDSNRNPLFVNDKIIHKVGLHYELKIPEEANAVVFAFHDSHNWTENDGYINVTIKKWDDTEETVKVKATSNLYFRWASSGLSVKASDTAIDTNGTWIDYVNDTRPRRVVETDNKYFIGALDNIMVFDKILSVEEIKYLWNYGYGTEECYGEYQNLSTSSTSSSSIDSSSSSSSFGYTSSSSLSSLSSSSSSSFSSSSFGYTESSSLSSNSSESIGNETSSSLSSLS